MNLFPIGLPHVLALSGLLFGLGAYGVSTRRNAVASLMSVELMLNGVNLALVAFNRYRHPEALHGQAFALFIIALAAAEAAVGMALVLAVYRRRRAVLLEELDELKG